MIQELQYMCTDLGCGFCITRILKGFFREIKVKNGI